MTRERERHGPSFYTHTHTYSISWRPTARRGQSLKDGTLRRYIYIFNSRRKPTQSLAYVFNIFYSLITCRFKQQLNQKKICERFNSKGRKSSSRDASYRPPSQTKNGTFLSLFKAIINESPRRKLLEMVRIRDANVRIAISFFPLRKQRIGVCFLCFFLNIRSCRFELLYSYWTLNK